MLVSSPNTEETAKKLKTGRWLPSMRKVSDLWGEWALCGTESSRTNVLRDSTFALVMAPTNVSLVSTTMVQIRVYEAIRAGAIPVLLGGDQLEMAYGEVVDWHKAALFLPKVCYNFITVIKVGEKGMTLGIMGIIILKPGGN
jgi:hypothetical protein